MKLRDIQKPVLFLDFETTGQLDERLPYTHDSQPRILQFGWVLSEPGSYAKSLGCCLVDARVIVPESASALHGITREQTTRFGMAPKMALGMIYHLAKLADHLCAFLAEQQFAILEAEFLRNDMSQHWTILRGKSKLCLLELARTHRTSTGKQAVEDGATPSFESLHQIVVGTELLDPYDAFEDARATWRMFECMRKIQELFGSAA